MQELATFSKISALNLMSIEEDKGGAEVVRLLQKNQRMTRKVRQESIFGKDIQ